MYDEVRLLLLDWLKLQ
ncbi:hypothetical protein RDI58_024923 [Solanum bulbocastanum]|uniref:Uncharacterized protein n=1 Tax=Solanum bulbocastanum TaxID=147425 RepID=A0AAN8SYI5_SOLBU